MKILLLILMGMVVTACSGVDDASVNSKEIKPAPLMCNGIMKFGIACGSGADIPTCIKAHCANSHKTASSCFSLICDSDDKTCKGITGCATLDAKSIAKFDTIFVKTFPPSESAQGEHRSFAAPSD